MDSFFHSITTLRHSSSKIIHYVLRVSTMASYIFITHRKTKFNNLALNPQVSLKKLTVPQLQTALKSTGCVLHAPSWHLSKSTTQLQSQTHRLHHHQYQHHLRQCHPQHLRLHPRLCQCHRLQRSTGSLRWKLCSKTCLDAVWETRIDREIRSELRLVLKQMWFRKWFWSLKFIKISSMKDYANSRLKLKRTLIWAFCLHKFGDI